MNNRQTLRIKRDFSGGTIFLMKEKVQDGVDVAAGYLLLDELLDDFPREALIEIVTRTIDNLERDIDRLRWEYNPDREFMESI